MKEVVFEILPGVGGNIGKIILNRPKNLNALNFQMCENIFRQLTQWEKEKSIKAVIISSAGGRAFCAGGDVRALYETVKQGHYEEAMGFFIQEYAMNQAIFDFQKPYIAFLDGVTMGGGVGVSIHGSHSIATERLVWAMPETRIGFFPDVGVCYHLSRLPDNIGDYLALTGEQILANDAYHLGLVTSVIPSVRLEELENKIIKTPFSSTDFDVVTHIIKNFHQTPNESLNTHKIHFEKIKKYFSRHQVEDILSGLISEEDDWCQATAKTLAAQSPLSLKITHTHLRHCSDFSFSQVMAENKHLVQKFIHDHDFIEGIRALLIDKDRTPHWQPPTLSEVTCDAIKLFFSV